MKYIIMCGGEYDEWETPKQLLKIKGEVLIERTIRQLRENGITDIAISTNNRYFDYLGLEILKPEGHFIHGNVDKERTNSYYTWLNAYVPMNEPVCYLHGDVYFSNKAIKTIVNMKVEDTMFFCTCDGTDKKRDPLNTKGREPFGYKVENYQVFQYAIKKIKQKIDEGFFKGYLPALSWHLYRYLNGFNLMCHSSDYKDVNNIFKEPGDYIIIDDYTSDIDTKGDIDRLEKLGDEVVSTL